MKVLSLNYRGVVGPSNKTSLKRLVESHQLDVLMLQETLGAGENVSLLLESLFPHRCFIGLDARGRLRGLAIGWNQIKIKLINSWGFDSGLGVDFLCVDLGRIFTLLNIYEPYQDRVPYWDALSLKSFFPRKT